MLVALLFKLKFLLIICFFCVIIYLVSYGGISYA